MNRSIKSNIFLRFAASRYLLPSVSHKAHGFFDIGPLAIIMSAVLSMPYHFKHLVEIQLILASVVQNQGQLVHLTAFLIFFPDAIQEQLYRLHLFAVLSLLREDNLSEGFVPMKLSAMQVHLMIFPLEVTPLHQAFENRSRDQVLLLFFLIQLHDFVQKFLSLVREGRQPAVWASIFYLFDMTETDDGFAARTLNGHPHSLRADYAGVFRLEGNHLAVGHAFLQIHKASSKKNIWALHRQGMPQWILSQQSNKQAKECLEWNL